MMAAASAMTSLRMEDAVLIAFSPRLFKECHKRGPFSLSLPQHTERHPCNVIEGAAAPPCYGIGRKAFQVRQQGQDVRARRPSARSITPGGTKPGLGPVRA